jgi:hypothetical protein
LLARLTNTVVAGVIGRTFGIVSATTPSIDASALLAALPLRTIVIDGAAVRILNALALATDLADGAIGVVGATPGWRLRAALLDADPLAATMAIAAAFDAEALSANGGLARAVLVALAGARRGDAAILFAGLTRVAMGRIQTGDAGAGEAMRRSAFASSTTRRLGATMPKPGFSVDAQAIHPGVTALPAPALIADQFSAFMAYRIAVHRDAAILVAATRIAHLRPHTSCVEADMPRRAIPSAIAFGVSRLANAILTDLATATFGGIGASPRPGGATLQVADGAIATIGGDSAGAALSTRGAGDTREQQRHSEA